MGSLSSVLAMFVVLISMIPLIGAPISFAQLPQDSTLPSVKITEPILRATMVSDKIVVRGTAFDNESGIHKVEAFIDAVPFDGKPIYRLATPIAPGDWSLWSIELDVSETGTQRLTARAIDKAGNTNWYEITINIPFVGVEGAQHDKNIYIRTMKPLEGATLVSDKIVVRGTAFDNESGIHKVEAFIYAVPFDGEFLYRPATPIAPGDWSLWSIELDVSETGTNKIIIRATNNLGKHNWYELTANIPFIADKLVYDQVPNNKQKIALVEPTFTSAAYGPGGFYGFYPKYVSVPPFQTVTKDLDLLTAKVPDIYNQEVDEYYSPLINGIKDSFAEATLTVIRDEDVHDGNIFTFNGTNAFDVLILLHDEYVTLEMYDNYRDFVLSGGTLVLVDSNTFYARISYDRVSGTVTLVEGHDWKFDGNQARKGIAEYYAKSNAEFIGSNYLINQISDDITFDNNLFNYTHFEENQLVNPNASILHDFKVTFPPDYPNLSHLKATVAAYELKYGEGKVIALGIYGTRVVENETFQDFWSDLILLHALAPIYKLEVNSQEYLTHWKMNTGKILNMVLDVETKNLAIELDRTMQGEDTLFISLPRKLIDAEAELHVMIDGSEVSHGEFLLSHTRVLRIPLDNDASRVQVYGNKVLPEFPLLPIVIFLSFISLIFAFRIWHFLGL